MRMSHTTTMRLQGKFRLFALLKGAVGAFRPALLLAFLFLFAGTVISPSAEASAALFVSQGMHAAATHGEAAVPSAPIALPRAPVPPAYCVDRHHPCGPGATAHAEPVSLELMRHVGFATPRAPEQAPARDAAPHRAVSILILFQNFRE